MMADFQKTFNPTEEDKEELVINLLTMIIELVKDKCCSTCKYSECRKEYMHSYETTEIYCKKKGKVTFDSCNAYEVRSVLELLR